MASLSIVLCSCLIIFMAATNTSVQASIHFQVGGSLGWHEPDPNNTEFYSQWAQRNRFQVGDALVFEYQNDSVLRVEKLDYMNCDASNPIIAFDNGKSTFILDRPGDFYFISGTGEHCKNGQRLVVDVIHEHHFTSPPPISLPPQGFPPMASPPDQSFEDSTSASVMITATSVSVLVITFVIVVLLAP
ncbi:hypothetical protein LR48_Vigan05g209400 [Vigna angularis]|uniref:Early nodulin-like protein n=2 Tax=Phaseolus angularis TaxID=3914 RepID=A0A0L9UP42_PHAAN|nr:mavicyanin [Vigna angularis]KAG2371116.1 Early nodulin-like protein [Vigna angularis]KOM44488.1 hypothetical protein LR48_Vigan05g209300 [Vigna angularis]KOM44489.1 hypothetical protein LR48_Vigan05g209400 [Vigna angularis]BAT91632.1 hypothetical protein VIGAN_07024000 [Vigna angularis var. angularis]